ncbi:MAG: hypothetical protein V4462_17720 [Pseudomonadota bacterium]
MSARRRPDTADDRPTFDLAFIPAPASSADPLAESIVQRCVQRRPLRHDGIFYTRRRRMARYFPAPQQVR